MTRRDDRSALVATSAAKFALADAWLTIVSPIWPRGHLRLAGAAGIAEGVFLLLVSTVAPVGDLATLCLVAGEIVFVASFAPARR